MVIYIHSRLPSNEEEIDEVSSEASVDGFITGIARTSFSPHIVFCHLGNNWPRRDMSADRNDVMLGRASDGMTSGVADER